MSSGEILLSQQCYVYYRGNRGSWADDVAVCINSKWSIKMRQGLKTEVGVSRKLVIGGLYRPHKRSPKELLVICGDSMLAALSESDVLLFGDFNIHIKYGQIQELWSPQMIRFDSRKIVNIVWDFPAQCA